MNCLVLGGNGFIGSHLCDALISHGHSVRIFERTGSDRSNVSHLIQEVQFISGDFSEVEDLRIAVSGVDVIYHLISTTLPKTSNQDPKYDISSNVGSTIELLNIARECRVKKIIYASSGGTVYGTPLHIPINEQHPNLPTCSYGIHKLMIEKYLELFRQLYGLQYSVMRISNPYGQRQNPRLGQGVIAVLINKSLKNEEFEVWGDGSVSRDYLHVFDVVQAAVKMIDYNGPTNVFNIGSGVGKTLNELIHLVQRATGRKLQVNYKPARKFDVPINILDISKAREELKWRSDIDLERGIQLTVDYALSLYRTN